MKDINSYIVEKLKINKDIKVEEIKEKPLSKDYVFVVAYGQEYDNLADVYSDSIVSSNVGDPDGFILPKLTGESFANNNSEDITVYRIPMKYKYLEDFTDAYETGECSYTDNLLKEI